MSDNKNWGNFTLGFGIGLVSGFIIAMLLTPKPGSDSREFVKEKIEDLGGRVKEVTADRKKVYAETWKKPKVKPYMEEFENTD